MKTLKPRWLLAVSVVMLGVVLLMVNWTLAAMSCSWDTSYCASGQEKNRRWTGVLVDSEGRLARNHSFAVHFESRRGRPAVNFTSGPDGRFCIRWADEQIAPSVYVDGAGTQTQLDAWRGDDDPPGGCQTGDAGVPWNRASDVTGSWQVLLIQLVPLVAIALALGSSLVSSRTRCGQVRLASGGVFLLGIVVSFVAWGA
jgi:hypothetical protein